MTAYVYMVRCKNNSLYTGWTKDLGERIKKHVAGTGAKYTKAFGAQQLVYFEELEDRSAAMKREYALKQLNKKAKEDLINQFNCKLLEKSNKK